MPRMRSENEQRWAARVAEWRASGLTAPAFCVGRGFTAGGLRHWAHVLKKRGVAVDAGRAGAPPPVRLVRVERSSITSTPSAPLTIELGGARVTVPAGFDAATLGAVVDLLRAPGTRGGR